MCNHNIVFLRMMCELETNCVAIERIFEYVNNPQEDEWIKPTDDNLKEWPSQGEIEFSHYKTQYR